MAKAFGLANDIDPSLFKCKNLETLYADMEKEIGTGSVRRFVALYKGLPYKSSEETYLPDRAVEILKDKSQLSKEHIEYIDSHSVNIIN